MGCREDSPSILVKCNHTQVINKITLLHTDLSDEKRCGDKLYLKKG
jgi:hypothetical protein